jgi:heat shock protein 4
MLAHTSPSPRLLSNDCSGMMTRDHFEELAAPVLAKLRAPMEAALADSGLKVEDISSVEVRLQ